jgi:hypothetical protein
MAGLVAEGLQDVTAARLAVVEVGGEETQRMPYSELHQTTQLISVEAVFQLTQLPQTTAQETVKDLFG